jgi:hypothetical protein
MAGRVPTTGIRLRSGIEAGTPSFKRGSLLAPRTAGLVGNPCLARKARVSGAGPTSNIVPAAASMAPCVCGDCRIQSIFNPDDPSFHKYDCSSPLISGDKCKAVDAYKVMLTDVRFVAPSSSANKVPVSHCMISMLVGVFSPNPIRIARYDNVMQVVNYTLPGHVFHPGKVIRTVFERDGVVWVGTYGVGTGDHGWFNAALGPNIFMLGVDESLRVEVLRQFDNDGLLVHMKALEMLNTPVIPF